MTKIEAKDKVQKISARRAKIVSAFFPEMKYLAMNIDGRLMNPHDLVILLRDKYIHERKPENLRFLEMGHERRLVEIVNFALAGSSCQSDGSLNFEGQLADEYDEYQKMWTSRITGQAVREAIKRGRKRTGEVPELSINANSRLAQARGHTPWTFEEICLAKRVYAETEDYELVAFAVNKEFHGSEEVRMAPNVYDIFRDTKKRNREQTGMLLRFVKEQTQISQDPISRVFPMTLTEVMKGYGITNQLQLERLRYIDEKFEGLSMLIPIKERAGDVLRVMRGPELQHYKEIGKGILMRGEIANFYDLPVRSVYESRDIITILKR